MLPDIDGFTLCRQLRKSGIYLPVLMLTARHSASDRVQGLDAGADDYLTKPLSFLSSWRVRSLLRRRQWNNLPSNAKSRKPPSASGRFKLISDTHEVLVRERASQFNAARIGFDSLLHGKSRPRVLSRDELLEKVWKLKNYPNTRTVDNFIVRLRKHFEPDPRHPMYFKSVRGAGYKFVLP